MTSTYRRLARLFCCLLMLGAAARAADPAKTLIQGVLYRADGALATGTLVISWPAFITAEAVTQKEIIDENKFRTGLGQIIDGTVQCLNASTSAKAK